MKPEHHPRNPVLFALKGQGRIQPEGTKPAMSFLNTFKDGEFVPTSGLYAALHSTPHRLIERSVYIKGTQFQRCRMCPLGVLYRLEEPTVLISSESLVPGSLTSS